MQPLCRQILAFALLSVLAGSFTSQTIHATSTPGISERVAGNANKLDINTATYAQLIALPGMGDVYVKRIIDGRPYTVKNQLVTRGVLPQASYEKIKDRIIAHRHKK